MAKAKKPTAKPKKSTSKKVKFQGKGMEDNGPAGNPHRTKRISGGGMGASLQKGRRRVSPR